MYSRIIDGEEHTFGVSGKLVMNVLVMYDRETNTLWSQLLGEGISGPLQGVKLNFEPSVMTTWEDWKTQHPDTLAIEKGYYGNRDPYNNYYASDRAGVIGETIYDERLHTKEFVLGIALGDDSAAFPFSILNEEPVVNYILADTPILVAFNVEAGSGAIYSRVLNGQTLTFESGENFTLIDNETNSTWDAFTGTAIGGELSGETLTPLKYTASFWFGWKDFYPETFVYGIDGQ